jgi:hypothetical protein
VSLAPKQDDELREPFYSRVSDQFLKLERWLSGEAMSEVSSGYTVAHDGIEWKAVPKRPCYPTTNYLIAWGVALRANKAGIHWTNWKRIFEMLMDQGATPPSE